MLENTIKFRKCASFFMTMEEYKRMRKLQEKLGISQARIVTLALNEFYEKQMMSKKDQNAL